ncbi:hypothetical protein [Streptomyces caeruleatus]|uniref:Uncharacterized protein n=1 Tax=Streptomyces caeruleatus TaxID=661399 RepID=A0A117RHV4_9ACTN|nr:hypothetical protein [Streptomyces caeruleatus]KUN91695.1 hypothetical protein AQJ67_42145 [Streptomyces caeruleatus]
MNDDEQRHSADGDEGADFEEQLRELLAETAHTFRPPTAPYPVIRRRGVIERRRRVAAAGAVLVTLAAMPVGAYALGGRTGTDTATPPGASAGATRGASPMPTPTPTPSGPARPATKGQLLDGITFAQAAEGLESCLEYQRSGGISGAADPGAPADYRVLLAMNSTGDSNAPGDGMYVVALREKPERVHVVCNIKNGETQAVSGFGDDAGAVPDEGPVYVDPNSGRLFQQSFLDRGHWKLPFRWGVIGTVKPSVARVTVSYGESSAEAALDDGRFVASGVLKQQVTLAPHIKGYDADGTLIYDSDDDKYYQRALP